MDSILKFYLWYKVIVCVYWILLKFVEKVKIDEYLYREYILGYLGIIFLFYNN